MENTIYDIENDVFDVVKDLKANLYSEENSDKLKFFKDYCEAPNAAQGSKFDANANVDKKTVATLVGELPKKGFIRLNRRLLVDRLKEMFGKEEADKYLYLLGKHFIYKNDETSLANYCASITMYPWLLDGTKSIGGTSIAPTNLKSFCGGFINLVFIVSSMLSGACATPEFLMYMNYFLGKEYGEDYFKRADEIVDLSKKKRTLGKVVDDCFEQIIYSLNQPTGARNFQAVFWNISYYDKNYFDSLFGEFRFPDGTVPDWNGLDWLQRRFMSWFNNERRRAPLTFPVETMALLAEGDDVKDKDYADLTAKMYAEGHSFFTYVSDNADSLASCCFEGDEVITIFKNENSIIDITIADFVNSHTNEINPQGKNIESGFQIQSYNINGNQKMTNITGILKKKYTGNMYTFTVSGNSITITGDHILMVQNDFGKILELPAEIVAKNIKAFRLPITTKEGIVFSEIENVSVNSVIDKIVYDIQLEENHYFASNNVITHNCRLRNQITDNGFSYTLGAGGVSTGSKSVLTVNVNRTVQKAVKSGKDWKEFLENVVEHCHKVQLAYNENVKWLQSKKMLPLFDAGYININRQYLTIGVNGLVEAAEFLGLEISDNPAYEKFVSDVLGIFEKFNKEYSGKNGIMFNCEMIPAENVGVKHAKWDREDGYFVPRDCYNSYFYVVEDEKLTLLDKFKLHGKRYVARLTGGSALHANLSEHLSFAQYRQLLKVAVKEGTNYFTFNIPNTVCNDCGTIDKHYVKQCPHCGSKNVDYLTRVIGYLKRVSAFSFPRQEEAARRRYHSAKEGPLC